MFTLQRAISAGTALVLLSATASSCRKEDVQELVIFHTNDLHYQLHPPKSDYFGLGGMARLSTLLNQQRAQHDLTVTLDAGDWSEGSWYFNLDAGATMIELFNEMKFDAAVVGNHDYLSGPDRLSKLAAQYKKDLPLLGANFSTDGYENGTQFSDAIPGTVILEKEGIKIGVIGLTTVDYVYSFWLNPVKVSEPIAVAQAQAKLLRPKVDVLLILSHNSFSLNEQVARAVYGVDAVISGHSHRKVAEAVMVENAGRKVPVVETGNWGRYLGELRLIVNSKEKWVKFGGYRIHPVDPKLEEDPKITSIVERADQELAALYGGDIDEVIGESEIDIRHDDSHEANLGDIASQSYRASIGADVGLEQLTLTGTRLRAGPITVRDAHDILPHIFNFETGREWTVHELLLSGADLETFLTVLFTAQDLDIPIIGTGFFSHSGVEVDWEESARSSGTRAKITEIRVGNSKLDRSKTYRVALTDGVVLALRVVNDALKLGLNLSRIRDTEQEGWRAIRDWIRIQSPLTEQKLRQGTYQRSRGFDLGVSHYGARLIESGRDLNSRSLQVDIVNDGRSPSPKVILRCYTGAKDDAVKYGTSLQKWDLLGERLLGTISPGARLTETLEGAFDDGIWPVKCELVGAGDSYSGNDEMTVALRAGK